MITQAELLKLSLIGINNISTTTYRLAENGPLGRLVNKVLSHTPFRLCRPEQNTMNEFMKVPAPCSSQTDNYYNSCTFSPHCFSFLAVQPSGRPLYRSARPELTPTPVF